MIKTRAIILPTPGDPYICGLWLSAYKRNIESPNTQLYVCVNSGLRPDILDYTAEMFERGGAKVLKFPGFLGHGVAINKLLDICTEDNVFILEDDFYILNSGITNKFFSLVESGEVDVIASRRGSCSRPLMDVIVDKFKLVGQDALEPNFWPCLFLCNKKVLLSTDRHLDSKNFSSGEYIPELSFTTTTPECGDTFVWTSIQIRAMSLKIHLEPQHRVTTDKTFFDISWVHIGSSSSGLNGGLLDRDNSSIGAFRYGERSLPQMEDEHLRQDWGRRYAHWSLCLDSFPIIPTSPAVYFNDVYRGALDKLRIGCQLSASDISRYSQDYRKLFSSLLS